MKIDKFSIVSFEFLRTGAIVPQGGRISSMEHSELWNSKPEISNHQISSIKGIEHVISRDPPSICMSYPIHTSTHNPLSVQG